MTIPLDPAFSAALWIIIKATVVLALAAIVQAVMHRRTSAAMRHLVWTLAIVGVLLLPILSLALPEWAVVTRTAATNAGVTWRRSKRTGRGVQTDRWHVSDGHSRRSEAPTSAPRPRARRTAFRGEP